jgi:hypothetical protein
MTKIKIFESKKEVDLPTLIDSRALICANSGGGKSYAVRKIIEESQDKVLSIIIDVEGEFKTLREQYDFLLIGDNADVSLNLKSASLLPQKILELEVSTIIDISELKLHERVMYVKKFLEALMEVPRELWKPCLVIVDEAHMYCGQQEKQESTHSVIDLMTRGRKRGFCGILATQRIAKLHKDAVAEANNYLVGRTGLDVDMKRASEILGFTSKEDMLSLRDLEPGEFYVFGTAISKKVEKEKVGEVKTTHPKVGMDVRKNIIKPTEKIKSILQRISDLPKEAEEEKKDKESLLRKINDLQRELKLKPKEVVKEEKVIEITDKVALEKAYERGAKEIESKYEKIVSSIKTDSLSIEKSLKKLLSDGAKILESKSFSRTADKPAIIIPEFTSSRKESYKKNNQIERKYTFPEKIKEQRFAQGLDNSQPLRAGAMKMLNWLAGAYPNSLSKQRLATLSGFSIKGGTFNTYISELKRNSWIIGNNDLEATENGLNNSNPEEIPSGEELIALWKSKFRDGAGKILQFVYENKSASKEEIGEATGFTIEGGTFNTYLSELRRNGLIEIEGNEVKISEEFF